MRNLTDAKIAAAMLGRDGIVNIPNYLTGLRLERLKEEFEAGVGIPDETNKSVVNAPSFEDSFVMRVCELYWEQGVKRTDMSARRLGPSEEGNGAHSFQWHIDCARPQLKAMLLLTDVHVNGQRMDYRVGSHHGWKPLAPYWLTRYSELRAHWSGRSTAHAIGKPGDLWIFDTNGVHRGNRNLGPVRDTITQHYAPIT